MSTPQKRAKQWGYEVEMWFLNALRFIFPGLRRVGSLGYSASHPDLVQDGEGEPIRIVATRDKRRDPLVTLSANDFIWLVTEAGILDKVPVVIQVKGRAKSWIGGLYEELKRATKV